MPNDSEGLPKQAMYAQVSTTWCCIAGSLGISTCEFPSHSWQAPDAPSKRITAKCTIKTYFFDLSKLGWSCKDLFNEVNRLRFDGAFCNDTF